ncbi:hypothetical protein ACFL1H_04235 [Nanoarchaeota archaeon]
MVDKKYDGHDLETFCNVFGIKEAQRKKLIDSEAIILIGKNTLQYIKENTKDKKMLSKLKSDYLSEMAERRDLKVIERKEGDQTYKLILSIQHEEKQIKEILDQSGIEMRLCSSKQSQYHIPETEMDGEPIEYDISVSALETLHGDIIRGISDDADINEYVRKTSAAMVNASDKVVVELKDESHHEAKYIIRPVDLTQEDIEMDELDSIVTLYAGKPIKPTEISLREMSPEERENISEYHIDEARFNMMFEGGNWRDPDHCMK